MVRYNSLDDSTKQNLKEQIIECAVAIGGKNHFLSLIEEIREKQIHPLLSKDSSFRFSYGLVKWGKVIFKDKVDLLITLTNDRENNENLMLKKGDKNYKTIMNFLRTLGPITFEVHPENKKDGDGFSLQAFDLIDENTSHLNFMFDVIFFLPINIVKKLFNGSIKNNSELKVILEKEKV
ncbi:MAG: hypothetical protein ACKVKJ_05940 [Fidelibacterota bacterium]|jgi:hypothetical protein|tara:strand:- start:7060 stop:7596 length:537 start_codon:yes stop_codon:yes gene_type:complete